MGPGPGGARVGGPCGGFPPFGSYAGQGGSCFLIAGEIIRLISGLTGRGGRGLMARQVGAAIDAELGSSRVAVPAVWTVEGRQRRTGLQVGIL